MKVYFLILARMEKEDVLQRIYIIKKLRQIITKEKCGSVCPSSYTKKINLFFITI